MFDNNLIPDPKWEPIPQIETSTIAKGGVGGAANAQALALLNNIEKSKKHSTLVFSTLSEAVGDSATMEEGQIIEVLDAQKQYKFVGGNLVFHRDTLELSLNQPAGATKIKHGDASVAQVLDSLKELSADNATHLQMLKSMTSGVRATKFKAAMDLNQRDVYLLLHGDSTGNDNFEFFYQMVLMLCKLYPNHMVSYRTWNPSTESWTQTTVQTGAPGFKILRVFNGSVPGANPIYWHGRLQSFAADGFDQDIDLVMLNYGLNVSTSLAIQKSACASAIYTALKKYPNAEVVWNLQLPDYTDEVMLNRSQLRSDAQRQIAGEFGVSVSDVFTLFTQLIKDGGINAWYSDKIHPNAAGSLKWAEFGLGSLLWTTANQRFPDTSVSKIPNGDFGRWVSADKPTWWATTTAMRKSQGVRETGRFAVEIDGFANTGNTGVLTQSVTSLFRKFAPHGRVILAARVYARGDTTIPGTLYATSVVNGVTAELRSEGNGHLGIGSTGWRWVFLELPLAFYNGSTDTSIGVFSGGPGESVVVDRVLLSSSYLSVETDGSNGFNEEYIYNDTSFDVPANSIAARNIEGAQITYLQPAAKVRVSPLFALPPGLIYTCTTTTTGCRITVTNTTTGVLNVPAGDWAVDVF